MIFFLLATVLALPAAATPSPVDAATVSRIAALGRSIFAHDRAAWLATDRLFETGGIPEGQLGWVNVTAGEGLRVLFVRKENETYCSRHSVLVDAKGAGPLLKSETCTPLTPEQYGMFRARQTAISAMKERCADSYNTVVLPYDGMDAAWVVYLLAATKESTKVVIGGHIRVLVSANGLEVVDYKQLSKTCLTMDIPTPDSKEPAFLVASHVLDDHPIETHVFLSLVHKIEIFVLTDSAMWSVDRGEIRLVMQGEEFKQFLEKAKQHAQSEPEERGRED